MDDLSNKDKEGLTINAVPAAETGEAEFQDFTRAAPTAHQGVRNEQLEEGESSPNRQARPAVLVTGSDPVAAQLFSPGEAGSLRSRWESIQVGFVDEPKRSVKQADQLVAEVISHLAEGFTTERKKLESQWDCNNISTEDLRGSFRRYRAIFERLLSI